MSNNDLIGYTVFGEDNSRLVPLFEYTSATQWEVKAKVLATARREGYKGTVDDRLAELEWRLGPVYAGAAQPAPEAQEIDPLRELIAQHAAMLEDGPYAHYCYFELAYTRRTEWMAWICSNHNEVDPNRKVLAQGQGSTADEACRKALAQLAAAKEQP